MHQTLLGIGHFFGAPWLVNPLEGALTLVLTYFIARRAYGESIGRLAAFLVWASPFILLMSCEFMNHASSLLFTTLMIFAYGRWLDAMKDKAARSKARCWALGVGLSAGYTFLTRPLTAVGVGLPFAVHAVWRLWHNRKEYLVPLLFMAAGLLACVLFQMWYNLQTTGDPLLYAYSRYHRNSTAQAMGIHGSISISYIFSKMHGEWFWLNINLFEWALPCAFFAMLVCLMPVKNLMTKLLIGVVASQTLLNMLNQFSSNIFGPRYLYETSTAMIILTAVGIRRFPVMLRALRLPALPREAMQGMIALIVIVACSSGLVYNVPVKIKDYTHFLDSRPDFYNSMLQQSTPPAIIFLGRHYKNQPVRDTMGKFRSMSWTNPPTPDSPVIFAWDKGDEKNKELLNYFPNRKAYIELSNKLQPIQGTPYVPQPTQP
jgi:hypothetical protein